ncbi:MAG TPA: glycine cleavage system aminomethyltransferase GcvT [Firmicutes bacterium]|nr:glycine cleavage system aminomethyltransferase GcvT [Bacillota bacterium]
MDEAKKTPFYEKHAALEGKIVDYSGWLLPVQFSRGLVEEVHATRRKATLFDVSHMGEVSVKGNDAEIFLQKIVTNDISGLKNGAIIYSPVCYPDGGVVDDILIYRIDKNNYFLVVNAANTGKDYNWFLENRSGDVELENLSADYAQLALQGPESMAILQQITAEPLVEMKYYHFRKDVDVAGANCIVSRTGYTGEDGFEIYCSNADASDLWDALWEAGQIHELSPAGLGARDVLRLEAAMPLYGHELSRDITPLQARLDRFVAPGKAIPFNGREALVKQKQEGINRLLFGLEMLERGVPREGYPVTAGDKEIGWVSSGSYSPTLDKFIAMAFLDPEAVEETEELRVQIRSRSYRVRTTKLPFYRREK